MYGVTAGFWMWLSGAVDDALNVALAVLLLAIVGWLLWIALISVGGRREDVRALLERWGPARRQLAPRVQIEDFADGALDTKMGQGLTALTRASMRRRLPGSAEELDHVTGQPSIADALADVKDLSSQLKVAVALASFLERYIPRRHFLVSGVLQPPGDDGPGLSLAVQRDLSYSAMRTFWARDLGYWQPPSAGSPSGDTVQPFFRLTVPAAAWLDHEIARGSGAAVTTSRDAASYAYFRAGLVWQREGNTAEAGRLYEAALVRDRSNVGALTNLAVIELREGKWDLALGRLQLALDAIEEAYA